MRRSSNPRTTAGLALLLLATLAAGSPAVAAEPPAPAEAAAAQPATNAVTITWNPVDRRFEAPTPEQAAVLASQFQQFIAAQMAGDGRFSAKSGLQVERLSNGMTRARLPLDYMNLSVVRVGTNGSFEQSCGLAEEAAELLQPAPAASLEVE